MLSLLLLLPFVHGALHGHKYHHEDQLIARATPSLLSLATSSVVVADYGPIFSGTATPCSGPACATAVPTSAKMCPAKNNTGLSGFGTSQDYTVICDVDFPAQNIYPFVLAGSFEACLVQCESYNKKSKDGSHCEGFVFAPERVELGDDCYLKSSLDRPFPATIPLVGATRAHSFAVAATPIGKQTSTSTHP